MSAATSSRSPATWSRRRCGSERERRREEVARGGRGGGDGAAARRARPARAASEATRESFRQRFADGSLDDAEVEIEVDEAPATPFEIPGMGGQVGMINQSMMGKAMGQQPAQDAASSRSPTPGQG